MVWVRVLGVDGSVGRWVEGGMCARVRDTVCR